MKTPTEPMPTGRPTSLAVNAASAVVLAGVQTIGGLVLYGYLIRTVGAEPVGVWVSLMAAGLLACMADLALNQALVRAIPLAGLARGRQGQYETIETLGLSAAVLTAVSLGLMYLSFPWWSQWLSLSDAHRQLAAQLVPWLVPGLWLNRVSDTFAGCLEGQQRFVPRGLVGISATALGLLLTWLWAPRWGMQGAAAAFAAQYLWSSAASLLLVHRSLPGLRWSRPRWRKAVFVEGVRYGLSLQGLVFCYIVLENGAKLMLVRQGFVSQVSYFDLAFRIGKGVRMLLASALRVMVPRLVAERDLAGRNHALYAGSFGLVVVVAAPLFAGLLAGADGLSRLVVGASEPAFMAAVALALGPWLFYCLTDPAINNAMATGHLRPALAGHLLTVLVAGAVVALPGVGTHFQGVFAAVTIGMLTGCLATLVLVHREDGLPWSLVDPWRNAAMVLAAVLVGLAGMFSASLAPHVAAPLRWACVALGVTGFSVHVWLTHPSARRMVAWLGRLAGRTERRAVVGAHDVGRP